MGLKPPFQLRVDVRYVDDVHLLPKARMHRLFAQLLEALTAKPVGSQGQGLRVILTRLASDCPPEISEEQHESTLIRFYSFVLELLDELDLWEEYLWLWNRLRRNSRLTLTYSRRSKPLHGIRFLPFILGEDPRAQVLDVHFLWVGSHRKEVIEKKLQRKRAGKKVGNLLHKKRSTESKKRLQEWARLLVQWADMIALLELRCGPQQPS
jgi:hypothetical protein